MENSRLSATTKHADATDGRNRTIVYYTITNARTPSQGEKITWCKRTLCLSRDIVL